MKIKPSLYKPGQEVEAPKFPESGPMKVVRLSALRVGRHHPQGKTLVFISVRRWVDSMAIVRPGGVIQWKIPMTPSGIESTTFRLVAQGLNYLRHRVPHIHVVWLCGIDLLNRPGSLIHLLVFIYIFEWRVLRNIFESKRNEVIRNWNIWHIGEFHDLYFSPNIILVVQMKNKMGEACGTYEGEEIF